MASWQGKNRAQEQLLTTTRDRHFFSTLYIASQGRDADLEVFFQRENQSSPPSISDNGKLRLATKCDLLPCLEDLLTQTAEANSLMPEVDMIVLDRPAIVNMLSLNLSRPIHSLSMWMNLWPTYGFSSWNLFSESMWCLTSKGTRVSRRQQGWRRGRVCVLE